ncbi:transcriptional regulator [Streptomyces chumphonensis]|uniref:transcriptional regulator n=1 Tax=Streptomyces chumphonensis TaxID=1214925 RepID=UPI003D71BE02
MATALDHLLTHLADEAATGALVGPAGTLYLLDGAVAHAECAGSPDVGTLLVRAGRLDAAVWRDAHDGGARSLLEHGHLTRGELEICHLGALHDAAYLLRSRPQGPVRFDHGVRHWLGPVRSAPVAALDREMRRRSRLLRRIWPHDEVDSAPVRPRRAADRPAGRGPVARCAVTPRQLDVLRLADGRRTPADIATALARPAYRTLLDVRRLAAAGLVETPHTSPTPLPRRRADDPPPPAPTPTDCPDIATLRRIRDALEALR